MCGIIGIVAKNACQYDDRLDLMMHSILHRGPDDRGKEIFPDCALGHVRLSIVDLKSGHQPMMGMGDQAAIVFNGEIYGYQHIRDQLVNDYSFKTHSDTEVILALHEKFGQALLEKLPGMFSFAIWDNRKKTLFCARDRFGEKPFYYGFGRGGEFIFASEIKAILASGLIDPIISLESVSHYLKFLYVSPRKTIYKNIFVLPPAHFLSFRAGDLRIERYWSPPVMNESIGSEEAVEVFKDKLNISVKNQMVADVPVGVFLSGGLDSSTIVAVASRYKERLQTFSFGFSGDRSELPYARDIAKKYNTEHYELIEEEIEKNLPELILKMREIYEEPFGDSSSIPTFLMSRLARKRIKVILTGDGGDELFGGYNWYKPLLFWQKEKESIFWKIVLFGFMAKIWQKFNPRLSLIWQYRFTGARLSRSRDSIFSAHESQLGYFDNSELNLLGLGCTAGYKPYWQSSEKLEDVFRMDVDDYMSGDILVKVDRASMANSLELRAPFLDFDFASYCLSLPSRMKLNAEEDKIILRKAFGHAWTDSVRKRSKKGFGAPVKKWLGNPMVADLAASYLNNKNSRIFQIISFDETKKYLTRNNYQTWALLVLAIWFENYKYQYE